MINAIQLACKRVEVMGKTNSAVLIIAFNRPETTLKVLQRVSEAKPKKLYLSLDGPRPDNVEDVTNQNRILDMFDNLDWNCELKINKSENNLGCKYGPAAAIDWFFENEEEGIILEDDILVDPSFFTYCDILLEKYRDNELIGLICATNFSKAKIDESYSFSYFNHIWGWASWRRAWKKNNLEMTEWPKDRKEVVYNIFKEFKSTKFWNYHFDKAYANKIDAWDYQWLYSCWANNMMAILPNKSLAVNIGFGSEATHTKTMPKFAQGNTVNTMQFPMNNPKLVVQNTIVDDNIKIKVFNIRWFEIMKNIIRQKFIEKF